ncbi:MAG: hypothetical protein ACRDM1_05550 [Gaiellaceae bacterium]
MGSDHEEELADALADAQATEQQSLRTLEEAATATTVTVAGGAQLEALYKGHVAEARRHLAFEASEIAA